MNLYRVIGGPVQIGAGEMVGLTGQQVAPRARKLEVVRSGDGLFMCRPTEPVEFKAGETIMLAAVAKHAAARLVAVEIRDPVKAADAGGRAKKPAGQSPAAG